MSYKPTPLRLQMLKVVEDHGPLPATKVAEILNQAPSTCITMLKDMCEKAKWATRVQIYTPNDRPHGGRVMIWHYDIADAGRTALRVHKFKPYRGDLIGRIPVNSVWQLGDRCGRHL